MSVCHSDIVFCPGHRFLSLISFFLSLISFFVPLKTFKMVDTRVEHCIQFNGFESFG